MGLGIVRAQNDTAGDPGGTNGTLGGLVTTGGGFDAYNGNVQRVVTDLVVPGSAGTIPLAFSRIYNSRYNQSSRAFADAGWRHSYQWSGSIGTNTSGTTVYTINYPDGRTINFRYGRSTAPTQETFARGPVGCNDRLEVAPSRDPSHTFLHLSDGTQVQFSSGSQFGPPTALIDLYGAVTTISSAGGVTTITDPAGRRLVLNYGTVNYKDVGPNPITYSWNVVASVVYQGAQTTDANNPTLQVTYGYNAYTYDTASQGGSNTIYCALTSVVYPETSTAGGHVTAHYIYAAANGGATDATANGTPPLLVSADDPHFAGPMSRICYSYVPNSNTGVWGVVASENNFATGKVVSQLAQNNPGAPTVSTNTRGDAADASGTAISRTYSFAQSSVNGASTNALAFQPTTISSFGTSNTPGANAYVYYNPPGSANGQGYVASTTDLAGNTTNFATEPLCGKNRTVTLRDGRSSTTVWGGYDGSASMPYLVQATYDQRGNATTYHRYPNTGLVNEIDYPNGGGKATYGYQQFVVNGQSFYKVKVYTNPLGGTITYNYDETGQSHGGSGHVGLLTSVTRNYAGAPNGGERTVLFYDGLDRLQKSVDPLSVTTNYTYDNRHNVLTVNHQSDNSTVTSSYDDYGNCYAGQDENGFTTQTAYDEYHRPTSVTVPVNAPQASGAQVTSRYQAFDYTRRNNSNAVIGDALSHTDSNWGVSWQPSGAAVQRIFSPANWLTDKYDGMSVAGSGTPATPHAGNGYVHSSSTFYANGQVHTSTDAQGFTTTYQYDNTERLVSATDALNHAISYAFWGNGGGPSGGNNCTGLLQSVTAPGPDATNLPTVTTQYGNYDQMGRPLAVTDPKSNTFNTAYNATGQVTSQGDGAHNTGYTFDQLGRKTTLTYPDNSTEGWTYDAAGNVKTYTTRAGALCTYAYDGRNRCSGYQWSDSTSALGYSYDPGSRLVETSNAYSDIKLTYDDSGALLSEDELTAPPTRMVTHYTHDVNGNVDSITYPGTNRPFFSYDDQNRCTGMYSGSTNYGTYTYTNNWLTQRKLHNGLYTTYDYQANGRPWDVWHRHTSSGTNVRRTCYGYAPDGQVSWFDREADGGASGSALENQRGDVYDYYPDGSIHYGARDVACTGGWPGLYNSTTDGRVADGNVSYAAPSASTYSFGYVFDAAGNRTQASQMGQATINYADNGQGLNQYAGSAYTDGNGNTTNSAVGWSYTYNSENQMTGATGPSGQSLTFDYDAMGRLVIQVANGVVTVFYYSGAQRIEEHDSNNALRYLYFFDAPGSDHILFRQDVTPFAANPSGVEYYLSDALGNTTHIASGSGTILEQYLYDVYGTPSVYDAGGHPLAGGSGLDNRYLFKGQGGYEWLSQAGLYYARARFYLPQHGRWLQTDPVGQAGGLNVYGYCGNDPVNGMDPSGLSGEVSGDQWNDQPVLSEGVTVTGQSIPSGDNLAQQGIDSILNRPLTSFNNNDSFDKHPDLYPKSYNTNKGMVIQFPDGTKMTMRPANSWSAPWGLNDDSSLEIFNARPPVPNFDADTPAKKILAGFLPGTALHSALSTTQTMSTAAAWAATAGLSLGMLPVEEGFVATRGFWIGNMGREAAKDLFLMTSVVNDGSYASMIVGSAQAAATAARAGQIVPVFVDMAHVMGGGGAIFFETEQPTLEAAGATLQIGFYY